MKEEMVDLLNTIVNVNKRIIINEISLRIKMHLLKLCFLFSLNLKMEKKKCQKISYVDCVSFCLLFQVMTNQYNLNSKNVNCNILV